MTFTVELVDTGLTADQVIDLRIFQSRSSINLLAERVITTNIERFSSLLISHKKQYRQMCYSFIHQDFGMAVSPSRLEFRGHISFLCWRLNDVINQELGLTSPLSMRKRRRKSRSEEDDPEHVIVFHEPLRTLRSRGEWRSVSIRKKELQKNFCSQLTTSLNWLLKEVGIDDVTIRIKENSFHYELTSTRIPF